MSCHRRRCRRRCLLSDEPTFSLVHNTHQMKEKVLPHRQQVVIVVVVFSLWHAHSHIYIRRTRIHRHTNACNRNRAVDDEDPDSFT